MFYIETTIPPEMSISDYRRSRPRRFSLRRRIASRLRPSR
jgi:hypothetical protein